MTKVQWTRGGALKHDYTRAHIVYWREGVQYLGEVVGTFRDEDEVLHFQVKHFNGEPAPDVPCGLAMILERE